MKDRAGGVLTLGGRGGGRVALQLALLGAVGSSGLAGPRWHKGSRRARRAAALILAVPGAALVAGGTAALGRDLTPFPKPASGMEVRQEGVYALVRHPIYGGGMALACAWALLTSPAALVPAGLLVPLLDRKARLEEAWLDDERGSYEDYRRRVRRRFVPLLW